jgi:hypothetical protein
LGTAAGKPARAPRIIVKRSVPLLQSFARFDEFFRANLPSRNPENLYKSMYTIAFYLRNGSPLRHYKELQNCSGDGTDGGGGVQ